MDDGGGFVGPMAKSGEVTLEGLPPHEQGQRVGRCQCCRRSQLSLKPLADWLTGLEPEANPADGVVGHRRRRAGQQGDCDGTVVGEVAAGGGDPGGGEGVGGGDEGGQWWCHIEAVDAGGGGGPKAGEDTAVRVAKTKDVNRVWQARPPSVGQGPVGVRSPGGDPVQAGIFHKVEVATPDQGLGQVVERGQVGIKEGALGSGVVGHVDVG